jgi:hypothetical protein
VGIVLTVPPFPKEDAASPPEDDLPLFYREPPGAEDWPGTTTLATCGWRAGGCWRAGARGAPWS